MALACREEDILATDLALYNPQEGVEWNGLLSAPRLDDLQCAFSGLTAFLAAGESGAIPVYCLFDNEEVGSTTKQGAGSTFMQEVIERICEELGAGAGEKRRMLAASLMASADNGHAIHPNHPEKADKTNHPVMNGSCAAYSALMAFSRCWVSRKRRIKPITLL